MGFVENLLAGGAGWERVFGGRDKERWRWGTVGVGVEISPFRVRLSGRGRGFVFELVNCCIGHSRK